MIAKVENRDGKLFIDGKDDGFFLKRGLSLRFSAKVIEFVKKVDLDPWEDDPGPVVSEFFNGTATLEDTLGVIGDESQDTQSVPFTLEPWIEDHPDVKERLEERDESESGFEFGEYFAAVYGPALDRDLGSNGGWFVSAYLPIPIFQEIVDAYRGDRLSGLRFGVTADFWLSDIYEPAPYLPNRVTHYLAPSEHAAEPAEGRLRDIHWVERPQSFEVRHWG